MRRNIAHALQQFAACPALHPSPPDGPDGGYYLFPAVRGWQGRTGPEAEEALVLALLDRGVLVHPGFFYGDVPGMHLVVSALTEPAHFDVGIARLCAALADPNGA